ncbi:MAG TPA: hypothetical protein VEP49_03285, partial [Acidimicrobiia bacterium]|nr:hypothetical protein [Acidimicrobiia bacterium]
VDVVVEVLWFAAGLVLVVLVLDSAVRTFVLPRGEASFITRGVFVGLREPFKRLARLTRSYEGRDRVMALYAPVGLLLLPLAWLLVVIAAFTLMFHALGVRGFERAFEMSGSSVFTLGFVRPPDLATTALAFWEAASGLTLLALLIAYLPTIYGAFSRREVLVSQLAVRAGEPPSGVELLARAQRMERFQLLDELWIAWQSWFAEVEETHTSLAVLSFFRSPLSHRSWVTASGAVLDAASLRLAVVDLPFDPQAGFCIRGGVFALRAVAGYFGLPYDPDPAPGDPTSISEDEFLEACDKLVAAGIAVRADRVQAWQDFSGWRVNYDQVLIGLAGMVMAPYAPWSSDRSLRYRRPSARHHPSAGVDQAPE